MLDAHWTNRGSSSTFISFSNLLDTFAQAIEEVISAVVSVLGNPMCVSEFLKPEGEDDVFEKVDDFRIVASIVNEISPSGSTDLGEEEEECNDVFKLTCSSEQKDVSA